MKYLLNYSDNNFKNKQKLNSFTGRYFGGFDQVLQYSPDILDNDFKEKNKKIISCKKGGGYWLWKPYIILKALEDIKYDDYLFYCDSGSFFIKNINPLIDIMNGLEQDILASELPLIEKQWTKRDAFSLLDCDKQIFTDTPQICGGYILIKKSKKSIRFFTEFLKCSENYTLISDSASQVEENIEFISHRHDQSIFSLLCKKNKLKPIRDISDYGFFPEAYYHRDTFLFDLSKLKKSTTPTCFILSNRKAPFIKYLLRFIIFYTLKKYMPIIYFKFILKEARRPLFNQ